MKPVTLIDTQRRWIRAASFLLLLRSLNVGHRARLYFSELLFLLFFCAPVTAAHNPLFVGLPIVIFRVSNNILSEPSAGGTSPNPSIKTTEMVRAGAGWIGVHALQRLYPDSFIGRLWFLSLGGRYLTTYTSQMAWCFIIPAVYLFWLRHILDWVRLQLRLIWSILNAFGGMALQHLVDDSTRAVTYWWPLYSPYLRYVAAYCARRVLRLLIDHFLWLVVARQVLGSEWIPSLIPWRDNIALLSMTWSGRKHVRHICDAYSMYKPRPQGGATENRPEHATSPFSSAPPFSYTALSQDKETIRLLLLHPRHRDDPISCNLFEVELSRAPRYEAVSYRWVEDKGNNGKQILLNDCAFPVSTNVFRLLQDFRSSLLPRIVWIDSICINQRCNKEKSHQVGLMGKIYSSATLVTIWLGSPSLDTSREFVMDLLHRMRGDLQRVPPSPRVAIESWLARFTKAFQQQDAARESSDSQEFRHKLVGAIFGVLAFRMIDQFRINSLFSTVSAKAYRNAAQYRRTSQWTPFIHLLEHDWFERVWVAQEVVLAPEARIMYGRVLYDWEDFIQGVNVFASNIILTGLLQWTKDVNKRTMVPTLHYSNAATMHAWRARRITKGGPPSFKDVICSTRLLKATDPRDKVFGVQGLAGPGEMKWTEPDYNKNVREVYVLAAERLIAESGAFEVLAHAGTGHIDVGHPGAVSGLPSWVPDWNIFPMVAPLGYVDGLAKYRAGGNAAHGKVFGGFQLDGASRSLTLRGFELDAIAEVGTPLVLSSAFGAGALGYETGELAVLGATLDASREIIFTSGRIHDPYQHTGVPTPLDDVFWRLLIGDRTETEWPAPASARELFDTWSAGLRIFQDAHSQLQKRGVDQPVGDNQITRSIPGHRFGALIVRAWHGRKVAITNKGFVCLIPRFANPGDAIWLVEEAQTPYVLRPKGERGGYEFVGDCYGHGVMDGSAVTLDSPWEAVRIM